MLWALILRTKQVILATENISEKALILSFSYLFQLKHKSVCILPLVCKKWKTIYDRIEKERLRGILRDGIGAKTIFLYTCMKYSENYQFSCRFKIREPENTLDNKAYVSISFKDEEKQLGFYITFGAMTEDSNEINTLAHDVLGFPLGPVDIKKQIFDKSVKETIFSKLPKLAELFAADASPHLIFVMTKERQAEIEKRKMEGKYDALGRAIITPENMNWLWTESLNFQDWKNEVSKPEIMEKFYSFLKEESSVKKPNLWF